ncbi:unnamed protein product, partial [Meganyctiphanes norvegica]
MIKTPVGTVRAITKFDKKRYDSAGMAVPEDYDGGYYEDDQEALPEVNEVIKTGSEGCSDNYKAALYKIRKGTTAADLDSIVLLGPPGLQNYGHTIMAPKSQVPTPMDP